MGYLNFQSRFAPLVESGQKVQTMRRFSVMRMGERVWLYTGQRTKDCRLLGVGEVESVVPVLVSASGVSMNGSLSDIPDVFARADGFADLADMVAWIQETYHRTYFSGVVIKWRLLDCAQLSSAYARRVRRIARLLYEAERLYGLLPWAPVAVSVPWENVRKLADAMQAAADGVLGGQP